MLFRLTPLVAALCFAQLSVCPAFADEAEQLVVTIRAVRAAEPVGDQGAGVIRVDARVRDLGMKLSKLPYRNFSLISTERRLVPMRKRESVTLTGGQVVNLRPLDADSDRVGMWIRWMDQSGMEVLDTKMHFDFGESMIAGTESGPDSGMVLAIDVTPARSTRVSYPH